MSIQVKPQPKVKEDYFTSGSGDVVVVGKDWALQNEIDDKRATTRARGCFRECRACGSCANSKRDNLNMQYETTDEGTTVAHGPHKSFDSNSGRWINCRDCEPFRFHDCHNGWMRDTRGNAEPFTPAAIELMRKTGGKPLI